MPKSIALLALLLAASLVWAYQVAHPPPDEPSSASREVTVWEVPKSSIVQIEWKHKSLRTTLVADWSKGGTAPEIRVSGLEAAKGGKSGNKEAKSPVSISFKGNSSADKALEYFAQPKATRRIGTGETVNLAEYGLDASASPASHLSSLEIQGKDGWQRRLELGAKTYGNRGRYIRVHPGGTVYLIPQLEIQRFELASRRLVERNVWPLRLAEASRIAIERTNRNLTLWRLEDQPGNRPKWALKPDAKEGSSAAQALVTGLSRLRVAEYLEETSAANQQPMTQSLGIKVFLEDSEQPGAWLSLLKPGKKDMNAVSSFNGSHFTIRRTLLKPLMDNLKKLLQDQ